VVFLHLETKVETYFAEMEAHVVRANRLPYALAVLTLAVITCAAPSSQTAPPPTAPPAPTSAAIENQKVTFQSDGLTLVGYLSKPAGDGPFPALISNHGSDHDPTKGMDEAGQFFTQDGYVVFRPMRRGHDGSQGDWIVDVIKQDRQTNGKDSSNRLMVELMATEQLDDQLAGLAYLKSLPYVDVNRIGVIGCSYGGIETIFGAESDAAGYKAAVAMSPAAESWEGNPYLQDRLVKAVSGIDIPVYLIHPAKDVSLEPGKTLAKEFERLGKPYQLTIYPTDVGTEQQQQHCFGGPAGSVIWSADVLAFFDKYLR
jgi:dienelactone hydrolase